MTPWRAASSKATSHRVPPQTQVKRCLRIAATQQEVGYKLALRQVDVSTAVFRLDRPFANTDPVDNVFKISGDQINYGVEFTLSGRLTDRLSHVERPHAAGFKCDEDRQSGDRRPAFRRHPGVPIERDGRISSPDGVSDVRERQLAVRRSTSDRRHQLVSTRRPTTSSTSGFDTCVRSRARSRRGG